MKGNTYGPSASFWYVVWSYTLCSFFARAGGEEEERRRTKAIFLRPDFATPTKVSETLRVFLHLDSEYLLVHSLRTGLRERFRAGAPIPYVQDAILNRRHPYIVIATAITDNGAHAKRFSIVY